MQQQRRGFSTFELILHVSGVLRLDVPYLVETGIGHLGSSSLRMIHRMTDPRTGVEVARLGQFGVNSISTRAAPPGGRTISAAVPAAGRARRVMTAYGYQRVSIRPCCLEAGLFKFRI